MSMPIRQLICSLLLVLIATTSFANFSFDRYQIILDRKPFGDEPPPAPEPARVIPPSESFAAALRLSAIVEEEDGRIKVGIVDKRANSGFFVYEGETVEGITLESASYEEEKAVISKGEEWVELLLSSDTVKPLNQQQQVEELKKTSARRPSYAERRAARRARRTRPPDEKPLTGDELQKHLQEYQMDVIRQGLPPLPIPLTQEMDDQLVTEGVLPPME